MNSEMNNSETNNQPVIFQGDTLKVCINSEQLRVNALVLQSSFGVTSFVIYHISRACFVCVLNIHFPF